MVARPRERERTKNSRRVSGGPSDGGSSAPSVERERMENLYTGLYARCCRGAPVIKPSPVIQ